MDDRHDRRRPTREGLVDGAAITGFPLITVPAGYACEVLPLGLTFIGSTVMEAMLLRLAYAFEHAHPVVGRLAYRPTLLDLP